MPAIRETILAARHARLQLPAGRIILRDGQPREPEVTLSPRRYHDRHRAELKVIVQGATDRATAFDTLIAATGTTQATDRTLGGLCDWVEAAVPASVDLPVDGAVTLKAAVVTVVLHSPPPTRMANSAPEVFAAGL